MMQLHREGVIGRPYQYFGQDEVNAAEPLSLLSEHIASKIMSIVTLTMSYVILSLLN